MGLRQKGGEFLTLYSAQVAQKVGMDRRRCPRDDPQMTLDGVDFPWKNDLQGCVFCLSHESASETTPGDQSRPGTTDLARTGTPSAPLPPYNDRGKGWGMGDPPTLLLL